MLAICNFMGSGNGDLGGKSLAYRAGSIRTPLLHRFDSYLWLKVPEHIGNPFVRIACID